MLGYILLIDDIDEITKILEDSVTESDGKKIFLINKDKTLLSKIESEDVTIAVQEINTESAEECVQDLKEAAQRNISAKELDAKEKENGAEEHNFLDFKGESVIGIDTPLEKINCCILSEATVEKTMNDVLLEGKKEKVNEAIIDSIIAIIIILVSIRFIDKKYEITKKKNIDQNEAIKKEIRKLNKKTILATTIFLIISLYLIIKFTVGFAKSETIGNILDTIVVFLLLFLILLSVKIKIQKNNISTGLFILLISKTWELILQNYQAINGITSATAWLFHPIIMFTGLLFILSGYKEAIK